MYLDLILCLFGEKATEHVEISSVFPEHNLQHFGFFLGPDFGFLFQLHVHGLGARVARNG